MRCYCCCYYLLLLFAGHLCISEWGRERPTGRLVKRLSHNCHKSNVVISGDPVGPILDAVHRRNPPELSSVSRQVQCAARLHKELLKPSGINKKYHVERLTIVDTPLSSSLRGEVSTRHTSLKVKQGEAHCSSQVRNIDRVHHLSSTRTSATAMGRRSWELVRKVKAPDVFKMNYF